MKIEGRIQKSGNYWAVEVPLLAVFSQGKTRKEAFSMVGSAIEDLVESEGFVVTVDPGKGDSFVVSASDETKLMAFALQQQRNMRGLTIRDVAKRLGSSSPTSYSRYEKGTVRPSLDKFSQLLQAIDSRLEPIIKVG